MATQDQVNDAFSIIKPKDPELQATQSAPASIKEVPNTIPEEKPSNSTQANSTNPAPSLENFRSKTDEFRANKQVFSEEVADNAKRAVEASHPALVAVNRLGNMTAEERARTGSRFGAGIGLATQGPKGSIIGAGIGAFAGRALGLIQSGMHESNTRKQKVLDALDNLGIRNRETGLVSFEDGGIAQLTPDKVFGNESGDNGPATMDNIDMHSPFVRRTTTVARPLARYITEGLLNYTDTENEQDAGVLDNTTAMLINTLQDGAKDIDTVYNRARELAGKIGISPSQARAFFHTRRGAISDREQLDINQGLDIIYG